MSTGYVFDPLYLLHDEPTHPENRARLEKTIEHLEKSGLRARLEPLATRDATEEEISRVHHPKYVRDIQLWSKQGGWFDPDTYLKPQSYAAAVRAAGGAIAAVDAVLDGHVSNAFALVRPPGHHALASRAMGFCLFNNVAIAAQYALASRELTRILIVDFDLHHGNGTQEAFYEQSEVLYLSTHQYPHYPGTGHWREMGRGAGLGYNVNVPLPAGTGDDGYRRVFDEIVVPIARRYRPQLIMASAGYDAHWMDPLGMMQLSVAGYVHIVRTLAALAAEQCGGRLVLTLEGGYSLPALAECVGATFEVLLGKLQVEDRLGPAQERAVSIDSVLASVKSAHGLTTVTGPNRQSPAEGQAHR